MRISDWSSDVCSSDLFRPSRLGEQRGKIGNSDAALLLLGTDIDLDEARGPTPGLVHPPRERGDERDAIDRMDRIEQRHRLVGIVRMEDRKSTRLNSSHSCASSMPAYA